jgi:hypothetical protein
MGWWSQNEQGHSFAEAAGGTEMVWGDEPADALDTAIAEIDGAFERAWGRKASRAELLAGLLFSLGGDEDDPRPLKAPERGAS